MEQFVKDKIHNIINRLYEIGRVQTKGAAPLALRRVNDFLSINMAGNKSGALLFNHRAIYHSHAPRAATSRLRDGRGFAPCRWTWEGGGGTHGAVSASPPRSALFRSSPRTALAQPRRRRHRIRLML